MKTPYTSPQFKKTSFNCSHCKAFASMQWNEAFTLVYGNEPFTPVIGNNVVNNLFVADCSHCGNYSLWIGDTMVYPNNIPVESPSHDLSEEIRQDYIEAANIINQSPRGAAALLRLAIEKLVNLLDAGGKDLNAKIGDLVKNGLNPKIQKSLDIVRVIGNGAVHPGQIDLKDDYETTLKLFKLVNIIADEMITKPKEVDSLYGSLISEAQKNGIKKRDS